MNEKILIFLKNRSNLFFPRIMTQVCRDENSKFYGCFDRNWWHYKIRDFPSIILQQGSYSIYIASKLKRNQIFTREIKDLAKAGCIFWNNRVNKYGSFEEYYPYERGYAPLAFSTLSTCKLINEKVIEIESIKKGIEKAAFQLLKRYEKEAMNQQIAGLAALTYINYIDPQTLESSKYDNLLNKVLNQQHKDGWFNEYDGPDIGYLSVSLDCFWDIYDITKNHKVYSAITKITDYITYAVNTLKENFSIFNSRNSNYILPYGLFKSYMDNNQNKKSIKEAIETLFLKEIDEYHFFDSMDDRYLCHYLGQSLFRCLELLETK